MLAMHPPRTDALPAHPGGAELRGRLLSGGCTVRTDSRPSRLETLFAHASPVATAVLVDGAFFVKRSRHVWGRLRPERAADLLHRMALDHLRENGVRISTLHRIFVYDAPPVS